jgi:hypothetical protein
MVLWVLVNELSRNGAALAGSTGERIQLRIRHSVRNGMGGGVGMWTGTTPELQTSMSDSSLSFRWSEVTVQTEWQAVGLSELVKCKLKRHFLTYCLKSKKIFKTFIQKKIYFKAHNNFTSIDIKVSELNFDFACQNYDERFVPCTYFFY